MKRFTFKTGTVPTTGGEGVEWEDGTIAYRAVSNDLQGEVITGCYEDLEHAFGGQMDYEFTWVDK